MALPSLRTLALAALVVATLPSLAAAQEPRRREVPGFDFPRDGVWRRHARVIQAARQAALARGDLAALNAPAQQARAMGPAALLASGPLSSGMTVSGVLRVPIFLVKYRNTDSTTLRPPADYDAALLGMTPPPGRPYTIRTYYEEISNGLLSVQGQVVGWILLDSNDTYYEGANNGLDGSGRVAGLMSEAVLKRDGVVDYGQFDNDGPDGAPNSGDDDGEVDLAVFVFPEIGGECGPSTNKNIWAHRFFYAGWTGDVLPTSDVRAGGGTIRVNSYTIQSGLGGATACDPTDILPPGTIAHETGHGFGLIDLYDTNPNDADDSEGIGHWGLMSSGSYRRPLSPAHMEGWSRLQLGWVTVRDVTASGTFTFGPYATGDTILRIVPTQPNPRGEYFLLENRQGVGSDTAVITNKGPGLLVFHIDQQQITQRSGFNDVNSGAIHGVWLRQADGLNQLRSSVPGVVNRGDAGDPFPGTANNSRFGFESNPAATLNSGGGAGFVIDSIRQIVPGGAMGLTVTFVGPLAVVDTALRAPVMGATYEDTVKVGGAVGTLAFSVLSGALPPGLTLGANGVVAGIPTATGVSSVVVRASASGIRLDLPLQLSTTAPTLVPAAVGDQLLLGGSHLTADEIRYLDLLGNRNGVLDVGDVAAWIDTGVTLDAATRSRLRGGRP